MGAIGKAHDSTLVQIDENAHEQLKESGQLIVPVMGKDGADRYVVIQLAKFNVTQEPTNPGGFE